mgnify:FL=1
MSPRLSKVACLGALFCMLCVAVPSPASARFHFHGGPVHDSQNIDVENQILSKVQEIRAHTDQIANLTRDSRIMLAARIMSLFGLDKKLDNSKFMKTLVSCSNSFQKFVGKTTMDLDNIPETKMDLLKEMGKFDLRGPANLGLYVLSMEQKKQKMNEEALYMMNATQANIRAKQKLLDDMSQLKTSSTQTLSDNSQIEVGSNLALTQKNNMMEATAASCDIDQAQLDLMMAAHDIETNRIKNMQKSAEQITGSVNLDGSLDPYKLNESQQKDWDEVNRCDWDMGFDGKDPASK